MLAGKSSMLLKGRKGNPARSWFNPKNRKVDDKREEGKGKDEERPKDS